MTDIREEAASAADSLAALVNVTDEGLKAERDELRRIADGVEGVRGIGPLMAAAAASVMAPLVDRMTGFTGPPGKDGAAALSGHGDPAPTMGMPGDTYINVDTGDVWKCS